MATPPVPDSSYEVARSNLETLDKYLNNTSGVVVNRSGQNLTPIPVVDSLLSEASDVAADAITSINSDVTAIDNSRVNAQNLISLDVAAVDSAATSALAVEIPAQINRLGLQYPPIAYISGLTLDSHVKTYSYGDALYIWGGAIGTVTTGDFDETGWQPIQGDVQLRNDVTKGTSLIRDVKHLSGIFELGVVVPQYDGQQFSVAGFYVGSNVGGGNMVWDSTRNKADHNGGTVIAPESIAAWDGTHNDLATLLNFNGSGFGCFIRADNELTIEKFGAKENDDCRLSLIKANAVATALKKPFGGSGNYRLTGRVDLTASFKGEINLTISSAAETDGLRIVRTEPQIIVPVTDLSWLVEGGQDSPLSQYEGYTLVITSTEVMSLRFGVDDIYYKNDINFVQAGGKLKYPLDCTYTTNVGLVVSVFKPEAPITIDGIEVYSENCSADFNVLDVIRSHVYLEDFKHNSDDYSRRHVRNVCRIFKSFDVEVSNKCRLNDADHLLTGSREGYGSNIFLSANVVLKCSSFRCKTNLSGRHGVDVKVLGGTWSSLIGGPLDSHWGTDFLLKDLNIFLPDAEAKVMGFAGRNITMKNLTVYGGNVLLGGRGDTPTMKGSVNISDIKWRNSPLATRGFIIEMGITEAVGIANFWGKTQNMPDNITIENVDIENNIPAGSDLGLYVLRLPINDIPRTAPKNIVINNVNAIGNKISGVFFRRLVIRNAIEQVTPIKVVAKNIVLGNLTNNFSIEKIAGTNDSYVADIYLENVTPLAMRIDIDSCSKFVALNANVLYSKSWSATGLPRAEKFVFEMFGGGIGGTSSFFNTFAKIAAIGVNFLGAVNPVPDWNNSTQVIHSRSGQDYTGFVTVESSYTLLVSKLNTPLAATLTQSYDPVISFEDNGDLSVNWVSRIGRYKRIGDLVSVTGELRFTPTFTTASGIFYISLPVPPKDIGLRKVGVFMSANFLKQFSDIRNVQSVLLTTSNDGANLRVQFDRNSATVTGITSARADQFVSGELVEMHYEISYEV